jgi:Tfp pilus assembly protein PilZ
VALARISQRSNDNTHLARLLSTMAPHRRERRHAPRRRLRLNATVALESARHAAPLELCDLSVSGCFLRSDFLFEINDKLLLSIQLPGLPDPVLALGSVVRVCDGREDASPPGMGIRFVKTRREDRENLTTWVEQQHDGRSGADGTATKHLVL